MSSRATIPILPARQEVQFAIGEVDFIHGFVSFGNLFGCAQMQPARLVSFVDPQNNLGDYQIFIYPNDDLHGGALDCIYDPSQGDARILVLHRNLDRTLVSAFDIAGSTSSDPINNLSVANTNGSLSNTGTHLFIGTFSGATGDDGSPDAQILKYSLTDFSLTASTTLTGLKQCHALQNDGVNLYATGLTNGSSVPWLAKIDIDTLAYSSVTLPIGMGAPTDDLAFRGNRVWIGTESFLADKTGRVLVIEKSDLSIVQNITPVIPSDFYGMFDDGTYIWAVTTETDSEGKMIRFDPATYEQRLYSFNAGEGPPNEMIATGGYLYVTTYKSGVKVIRLQIPST